MKYEKPLMDVMLFESDDVIRTSAFGNVGADENKDMWTPDLFGNN